MTTKKFQFGVGFGDICNEEAAVEQMRARNAFRNELVALDNRTRDDYFTVVNAQNSTQDRIDAIWIEIANLRDDLLMLRVQPARAATLKVRSAELRAKKAAAQGLSKDERKEVLISVKRETEALKKDIKCATQKATDDVAAKTGLLKTQIASLKKEATDLKPLADKIRSDNKEKNAEKLAKMNSERLSEINRLRSRAIAGYTETKTAKSGETYTVTLNPLYNLNADEISEMHQTERSRAMKEKTRLRFHPFKGEGRSSVRVHSTREKSDGRAGVFDALMQEINTVKAKRRDTVTKTAKADLSAQIATLEAELNKQVPLIVGQTVEETFSGESTLFRINPVNLQRDNNSTIWDKAISRAERRRQMRTVAHIRVNSDEKGKPVWVSLPVVMHRPFPQDARILSAAINRDKIGTHFRWNVEFTVLYEEALQERTRGTGIAAVDIGWAKDSLPDADGRVRVAGVRVTKNGVETVSEIVLPATFVKSMEKYNGLQALRDQKTNEFFEQLLGLKTEDIDASVRELMAEAKKSMTARKAAGKEPPIFHLRRAIWILRNEELAALMARANLQRREAVRILRTESKSAFRALLEAWYERWNHLNEWLVNGKDNLLAWRKDFYRRQAFALAGECDTLLLDADNFAKMAGKGEAESGKRTAKNDLRFDAAPSVLRDALVAALARTKVDSGKNHGFKEVLYSPEGSATSKTCRPCGKQNETLGGSRTFTCECGYTADREENATGNLMDLFLRKPAVFSCFKKVCERLAEKTDERAVAARV
jgi:hypothetical protein